MSLPQSRYACSGNPEVSAGWRLEQLTPPSRLYGANGLRTGPDGRIYVAQVCGSQISAVDINTGAVETISPLGGAIVGPDDLAFDASGNLYATEITEGRISVRKPNGETRVLYGDMPCANPITIHKGRLLAGECRPGGRIMELDPDGGTPRIILADVPMPNAMEVGPDGLLYFPVMGTNEIWRVSLDGGTPEKVAGDLGLPDAVKFDAEGCIVSTQTASGQVLRINPRTGERTVLATLTPGLDNLTFAAGRLFVSNFTGQISEILGDGTTRSLLPAGLQWPLGLTVSADGRLLVVDGNFAYLLSADGNMQMIGMLFSPGFPGYLRGVATAGADEYIVTTANGHVARWWPAQQQSQVLAQGFDQLYGVAIAPGGTVFFAEKGAGRVHAVEGDQVHELARGLDRPSGVAAWGDTCLVAEEGAGRIVKVSSGRVDTVLDGLQQPQGILVRGDLLYVVDSGAKELVAYNLASGNRHNIATKLPVGEPPGVVPKFLGAIGNLSGPMGPFAGIAAGPDGTLYVSADADGSVLALRPN